MTAIICLLAPAVVVEAYTGSAPAGFVALVLTVAAALIWPRPPGLVAEIVLALQWWPFAFGVGAIVWGWATGRWPRPPFIVVPLAVAALAHWRVERLLADPDYSLDP